METKESWSIISKKLAPILNKTASAKKYKSRRNTLFLTTSCVLALAAWFLIARWVYRGITNADFKEKQAQLSQDYGCNSIRDCIEKDSRKAARYFYSIDYFKVESDLELIIEAEAKQNIKNEKFQEGWSSLEKEKLNLYDSKLSKIKFDFLCAAVDFALINNKMDEAKKWALKGSPDLNKEGYSKEETNDFTQKETQRNLLIKRIKDFQKLGI